MKHTVHGRVELLAGAALVSLFLLSACSSDDHEAGDMAVANDSSVSTTSTGVTTTLAAPTTTGPAATPSLAVDLPEGPIADLVRLPIDGEVYVGAPEPYVADAGYVQEEFTAAGVATSYAVAGELTGDGEWTLEPDQEAEYLTRIVVRRPQEAASFSGTVMVEWMNVSGGVDADPEWTSIGEEVVRQGHAWVGVSAQLIGVEGGPVRVDVGDVPGSEDAGKGLKAIDPERYGDLSHPGDAFANDIFTQAARAIWHGHALDILVPETVVAAGESQSAFALVTYINGLHHLTGVFDGYFLHSRGPSGFPVLSAGSESADIAGSIGGATTIIRADLDVPVFNIQAENDVVGIFSSHRARQDDSDVFRLWEVAGTAHADRHLMGEATAEFVDCGAPINDGPMHVVAKAAFRHFIEWVVHGELPPESRLLELTDDARTLVQRDEYGIALGGVRTPPVDVPVQVLSGIAGPTPATICILSGSTTPLAAEDLAALYASSDDYTQKYRDAVEVAIEGGFVLEDDRATIESYLDATLISG
ncbi:MAG: alpha/beta hydrolase domain-containing protein [Acidimicrobiales bacterium]|nr:alpha/beta hydrolase domain-containing protein [Acidimicrobiales bacterium]